MRDNLNINIKYSSDKDDIIEDFYLPVLKESKIYKRAVGYFSSKILIEYISGLEDFIYNSGVMKLIVSPEIQEEDIQALSTANCISKSRQEELLKDIEDMLIDCLKGDHILKESAELFFLLIASGYIEVKIAVPKNGLGIFHEKIGIFKLLNDKKIAIIGSNNETYSSINYNHESFNTFCSWKPGQDEYIIEHESSFDQYWENKARHLDVFDIDKAFVNGVLSTMDTTRNIEDRFKELNNHRKKRKKPTFELDFKPYDYQEKAAKLLVEKKHGILAFATGAGKTKTAIYFMELLKEKRGKNFFLIVLPDKTLLEQWYSELKKYNDNLVRCYSDNSDWRSELRMMIDIYNLPRQSNQIVLVTNQTMFRGGSNSRFIKLINQVKSNIVLIVDELHNWSTDLIVSNLPESEYRLGLSATPFNSPMTNVDKQIEKYFGGIIAEYSLEDAINDKKLVPYRYIPIFVELTEVEIEQYNKLSSQIAKLQSMYEESHDNELLIQLELRRFARMRIIYGAENKIRELKRLLKIGRIDTKQLLIYCGATSYQNLENVGKVEKEAITQLEVVNKILSDLDISATQYTQKENTKARNINLELFTQGTIPTLVAIKCLDEGVDIPEIRTAVILASSTNKREFIQRRGRVLRRSPGKEYAKIFDFIVIDRSDPNSHINKLERARFIEFADLAMNKEMVLKDFKDYAEGEVYDGE